MLTKTKCNSAMERDIANKCETDSGNVEFALQELSRRQGVILLYKMYFMQ